jgi:hypothetical protein
VGQGMTGEGDFAGPTLGGTGMVAGTRLQS